MKNRFPGLQVPQCGIGPNIIQYTAICVVLNETNTIIRQPDAPLHCQNEVSGPSGLLFPVPNGSMWYWTKGQKTSLTWISQILWQSSSFRISKGDFAHCEKGFKFNVLPGKSRSPQHFTQLNQQLKVFSICTETLQQWTFSTLPQWQCSRTQGNKGHAQMSEVVSFQVMFWCQINHWPVTSCSQTRRMCCRNLVPSTRSWTAWKNRTQFVKRLQNFTQSWSSHHNKCTGPEAPIMVTGRPTEINLGTWSQAHMGDTTNGEANFGPAIVWDWQKHQEWSRQTSKNFSQQGRQRSTNQSPWTVQVVTLCGIAQCKCCKRTTTWKHSFERRRDASAQNRLAPKDTHAKKRSCNN